MLRLCAGLGNHSFAHTLLISCEGLTKGVERYSLTRYSVRWKSKEKLKKESNQNIYASKTTKPSEDYVENNINKIKKLFQSYWYVAVPLHAALTAGWACLFYTMAKSGLDVVSIFKYFNMEEETIVKAEKDIHSQSTLILLTFLLIKLTSPLRYAVSLLALRFLISREYIKPRLKGFSEKNSSNFAEFESIWKKNEFPRKRQMGTEENLPLRPIDNQSRRKRQSKENKRPYL